MNLRTLAQKVDLDEKDYLEMIDLFLETSRVHLLKLEMAIKTGEFKRMIESAHSIKGSAASLSLTEAYEIARGLEREARSNHLDEAIEAYHHLRIELKRIAEQRGQERPEGLEGEVYFQAE